MLPVGERKRNEKEFQKITINSIRLGRRALLSSGDGGERKKKRNTRILRWAGPTLKGLRGEKDWTPNICAGKHLSKSIGVRRGKKTSGPPGGLRCRPTAVRRTVA